tara:strand:+ start:1614 stop:1778 length:165 start_codon:yes stop_codon:yes gene_type:complete
LKKRTKEEEKYISKVKRAKKLIEDAISRRKPAHVTYIPGSSPVWADYNSDEENK